MSINVLKHVHLWTAHYEALDTGRNLMLLGVWSCRGRYKGTR